MATQFDFSKAAQKPPPTSKGPVENPFAAPSRGGRLGTVSRQFENRPITSNKSAGFGNATKQGFNSTANKFNQLEKDKEKEKTMEPEKKIKKFEKEIDKLIDETNLSVFEGDMQLGLTKAKEAYQKLKSLENFLDRNEVNELMNTELFCSVGLNLAVMYEKNELYQEAIQEYTNLTHAKSHESGLESYVRVNMGNIYFKQKNYSMAIRMYKKALDVVLSSVKLSMKYKIMKNLGHAFVQQNQFFDAINVYEEVLDKAPDFETAFNLMLCYYTIGDKEKMKNNFHEMLHIETVGDEENEDLVEQNPEEPNSLKTDVLKEEIKERKRKASKFILDSAKLIAPVIEEDIIDGYNYIIDILKGSKTIFTAVQSEIEICKANCYINKKQIDKAIETLKAFEKKDQSMMARASTNISFLYFLEGDYKNSEKYADMALNYDRYNAKALVNKGNCLYAKNDFLRAKENYLEAIGVAADCVEALYNLALVNKKLNSFLEALTALEKLQTIVSKNPEVIYQIASLHELMGNNKQALKWFDILLTYCPNDPNIHARVGSLYAIDQDESQAFHHYNESYKLLPVNIETIAWMGIYYVKQGLYDRACTFFERASQVQPKEVKWQLMVASCYRRSENYQKALKLYEEIYNEYPENTECLRFLVQICQELGLPYENYNAEFMRLKRKQEAEEAKFADFQNMGDEYLNANMENGPRRGSQNNGNMQRGGFDAPPIDSDYGGRNVQEDARVVMRQQPMGNQEQDDDWGGGGDDLLPD